MAGTGAVVTRLYSIDLKLFFDAERGLIKGQCDTLLDVAAPLRLIRPTPGWVPEEGIKNIAEATEHVIAVEGTVEATVSAVHSGVANSVIVSALL